MKLRSVTVYICYRMEAGDSLPKWKALRARVREQTPHGWYYGSDLVEPHSTQVDLVVSQCVIKLKDRAHEINFIFASDLQQNQRRFVDGNYVAPICALQS